MMQKLTYGGNDCKSYVYFSFNADFFDLEEVTKVLNISPTSVRIKKESTPKKTAWEYRIDAGYDIDLEQYSTQLLDVFESKIKVINQLKERFKLKTRLQFVIYIDINPQESTPYFKLNKRVINFLSQTETEVDYDLYKADTIGLLEKYFNSQSK